MEYLLDFPRMEKKGLAGKINLHQPHETPMMNLGCCDMNKAEYMIRVSHLEKSLIFPEISERYILTDFKNRNAL